MLRHRITLSYFDMVQNDMLLSVWYKMAYVTASYPVCVVDCGMTYGVPHARRDKQQEEGSIVWPELGFAPPCGHWLCGLCREAAHCPAHSQSLPICFSTSLFTTWLKISSYTLCCHVMCLTSVLISSRHSSPCWCRWWTAHSQCSWSPNLSEPGLLILTYWCVVHHVHCE